MTKSLPLIGTGLLVAALAALAACGGEYPPPPETERVPVVETIHGVEFEDPYRWLDEQDSPATRAFIDRQNEYAEQILGEPAERDWARRRLRELMDTPAIGGPNKAGDYELFTLRRAGEELASIVRRRGPRGRARGRTRADRPGGRIRGRDRPRGTRRRIHAPRHRLRFARRAAHALQRPHRRRRRNHRPPAGPRTERRPGVRVAASAQRPGVLREGRQRHLLHDPRPHRGIARAFPHVRHGPGGGHSRVRRRDRAAELRARRATRRRVAARWCSARMGPQRSVPGGRSEPGR